MINLNTNLSKLLALFGVIVFFMIGYFLFTPNENFYNKMLRNRIEEEYSGKILEKYTDSSNHSTPMLKLSTQTISLENVFWNEVEIGDSIEKVKGKPFVTLYKKDSLKHIFDYNKYFQQLVKNNSN